MNNSFPFLALAVLVLVGCQTNKNTAEEKYRSEVKGFAGKAGYKEATMKYREATKSSKDLPATEKQKVRDAAYVQWKADLIPVTEKQIQMLKAVQPPSSLAGTHQLYIDAMQNYLDAMRQYVANPTRENSDIVYLRQESAYVFYNMLGLSQKK